VSKHWISLEAIVIQRVRYPLQRRTFYIYASRRLNTVGHWLPCANLLLWARENRPCLATLSNNNDLWLTEIASEQTNCANEEKSWEISGTTFRTSEISVCRLSRGCFIADIKSCRAHTWRPSEQKTWMDE